MDYTEFSEPSLMQEIFGFKSLNGNSDFSESNSDDDIFKFAPDCEMSPVFCDFNGKPSPDPSRSGSDTMDYDTSPFSNEEEFDPTALSNLMNIKQELHYSSTDDVDSEEDMMYSMLLPQTIKSEVKLPDSPPVTPPQSSPPREHSPPHSPGSVVPQAITNICPSPPIQRVVTVKRNAPLIPKIGPIKVVTISSGANGTSGPFTIQQTNLPKIQKVPRIDNPVNSIPIRMNTSQPTIYSGSAIKREAPVLNRQCPQGSFVVTSRTASLPRTTHRPPIAPALNPSLKHNTEDVRAVKRQQRMIKNRESASLSRKKKKEYLQGVETDNIILKQENDRLRARISTLEAENSLLKQTSTRKNTTVLLGISFFLMFNAIPFLPSTGFGKESTQIFSGDWKSADLTVNNKNAAKDLSLSNQGSRHLLWFNDLVDGPQPNSTVGNDTSICPLHINATESIRIENELRGWFEPRSESVSKVNFELEPKTFHPKTRAARSRAINSEKEVKHPVANALTPVPMRPSERRKFLYRSDYTTDDSGPHSERTSLTNSVVQRLLDAIEQQDDTYYVLSLSHDHLLLPALAHNASARPKMSLIMPPNPHSLNQSYPPSNQLHLVQIDCQVMSTRLVQVTQDNFNLQSTKSIGKPVINVTKGVPQHKRKQRRKDLRI